MSKAIRKLCVKNILTFKMKLAEMQRESQMEPFYDTFMAGVFKVVS